jgi:hypothetical protein
MKSPTQPVSKIQTQPIPVLRGFDIAGEEARLESLKREAADLEQKVKLARGTQEIAPMVDPLEHFLSEPRSTGELARHLKVPADKVEISLKPLRKRLINVGTALAPAWFLRPGDDVPTPVLVDAVRTLITFRPMLHIELAAATGARAGRLDGALVALQNGGADRIVKYGPKNRFTWFIPPAEIKVATLKSRGGSGGKR